MTLGALVLAGCAAGTASTVTDTQTVTQTVTVPPPQAAAPPKPLSFSGSGIQTIGTVDVPADSTLKWTNDGSSFSIYDQENAVEVSSQTNSGTTNLAAGTYHDVKVNADGNWTIRIVPNG